MATYPTYQMFLGPLLLLVCAHVIQTVRNRRLYMHIPLVGAKSIFEPRIIATWRYFKDAKSIVDTGYTNFPKKAYRLMRNDTDVIVLPLSAIEELNSLPWTTADPTGAHVHSLCGQYTGVDLLLKTNLHYRVLQRKLTPSLGLITAPMEQELSQAVKDILPTCESWVRIRTSDILMALLTRMSARVFVGLAFCRDKRWLDISTKFTENIFTTVMILRLFPNWTHPLLSLFLPSYWRGNGYIRKAKALLGPELERHLSARSDGTYKTVSAEEPTMLTWLAEGAEGSERDASFLAHLEVLALAASITTQMNAVHALYDLATRPALVDSLRAEIAAAKPKGWSNASCVHLTKLDSLLQESQRLSPPNVLSYQRLMRVPYTLEDGTHLPAGAHICLPVQAIQNDPAYTPAPENFDPLRAWRARQEPGHEYLHQFGTAKRTALHFGFGKAACPGRWFAALETKILFAKLLMEYDFRLPEDRTERPGNLSAHEFIFPDPQGILEVRKRKVGPQAPF